MNFTNSRRMRTPSPHESFMPYHISSPQGTPLSLNIGPFSHRHSHSFFLPNGRVLSPDSRQQHCNKFSFMPPGAPFRPITEPLSFIQPVQSFDRFSGMELSKLAMNKPFHQKALSQSRELRFLNEEAQVPERGCATDNEVIDSGKAQEEFKESKERELQRKQREEIKQLKTSVREALEKKKESSRTSSFPSFTYSSENAEMMANLNQEKSGLTINCEEKRKPLDIPTIINTQDLQSTVAADTFRPFIERTNKQENLIVGYSDGAVTNRKLSFHDPKQGMNKSIWTMSSKDLAESKKMYTQTSETSEAKSELMRKFQKNLQTLTAENEKLQRLIHLSNPDDTSRVESERELNLGTRGDLETGGQFTEGEDIIRCFGCEYREESNVLKARLEEAHKLLESREKEIFELKALKNEFLSQSKSLQMITKSTQENRRELVVKLEKLERENKRLKGSLVNQEEMIKFLEKELENKSEEVKCLLEELPSIKESVKERQEQKNDEIEDLRYKVEILLDTNNYLNELVETKGMSESQEKSVMTDTPTEEKSSEIFNELKAKLYEALKTKEEALSILSKFELENKVLIENKGELENEIQILKSEKEITNKVNNPHEAETKRNNLNQTKVKALEAELYQAHITISDLEIKLHKLLTEKQRDKASSAQKLVEFEDKMNTFKLENSSMRDLFNDIEKIIASKGEKNASESIQDLMELIGDKRNSIGF